jgi:hypothetical protein
MTALSIRTVMMPCITAPRTWSYRSPFLHRLSAWYLNTKILCCRTNKNKIKMGILEYLVTSLVLSYFVLLTITFCSSDTVLPADLANIREIQGQPHLITDLTGIGKGKPECLRYSAISLGERYGPSFRICIPVPPIHESRFLVLLKGRFRKVQSSYGGFLPPP